MVGRWTCSGGSPDASGLPGVAAPGGAGVGALPVPGAGSAAGGSGVPATEEAGSALGGWVGSKAAGASGPVGEGCTSTVSDSGSSAAICVSQATRSWSRKNHAVPARTIRAMSIASRAGPLRLPDETPRDDLKRWEAAGGTGEASGEVRGGGEGGNPGDGAACAPCTGVIWSTLSITGCGDEPAPAAGGNAVPLESKEEPGVFPPSAEAGAVLAGEGLEASQEALGESRTGGAGAGCGGSGSEVIGREPGSMVCGRSEATGAGG
jgi:hypothetical protein